jgi:hypothetical protein
VPVQRLAAPLALGLMATALVTTGAVLAGDSPFTTDTWTRWDSFHYLTIATGGYELERCGDMWCGNTGWFPAYSWLVGALSVTGMPPEAAALMLARAFTVGGLVLLPVTFLRDLPRSAVAAGLTFAAFVPGAVYMHALFPLSMVGFFALLGLWLLTQERFAAAGAALAVAAASYHMGVLLLPVAAAWALLAPRAAGRATPIERVRASLVTGGVGLLGPLAVVAAMWAQTGRADAFLLVQERYAHGFHMPFDTVIHRVMPLFSPPLRLTEVVGAMVAFQVVLVVAIAQDMARRRRSATPGEWLLLAATLVLFLFPLTQANVGIYRTSACLLPAAPLVARLSRPLAWGVCACAVVLAVPMAELYFRHVFV